MYNTLLNSKNIRHLQCQNNLFIDSNTKGDIRVK